jgi:hypothetical protein
VDHGVSGANDRRPRLDGLLLASAWCDAFKRDPMWTVKPTTKALPLVRLGFVGSRSRQTVLTIVWLDRASDGS